MGATLFIAQVNAVTAQEGYETLYDQAVSEYGTDRYNGTISTCSMGRCFGCFDSKKEADKFLDSLEERNDLVKGRANYIDLGVSKYLVRNITKKIYKSTAKYKQKYAVCDYLSGEVIQPVKSNVFDQKTPADALALEYAKKGRSVCVRKMMVLLEGEDTVTTFRVSQQTVNKPTKAQMPNATPLHQYIFFGLAYC